MKTFMANDAAIAKKWLLIDAANMPLGRVAAQVAAILRGKHKAEFTPHVDCGDYVVVINTEKVILTGRKLEQKMHRYHTLYMGGLKERQYKSLMPGKADDVFYYAVKGMLPKNALGRKMLRKLKIHKGADHPHAAQNPVLHKLTVKKYEEAGQ